MNVSSYRPMTYTPPTTVVTPPPKPTVPNPDTGASPNVPGFDRNGFGGKVVDAVNDFGFGVKYGAQQLLEFIKHPFDESKRQGPWRNPCEPESLPERIGRWVPGAALAVAGFFLTRGLFGGHRGLPHVGFR